MKKQRLLEYREDKISEMNEKRLLNNIFLFFALIFVVVSEIFFFRNVLFSDSLIGDSGDGRLTMLFAEHWFHVFSGRASVTDMGFFYPAEDTIAYSDMLLAYGLVHSFFRIFGLDVFLAYKYTIILIHLAGTVMTFILLYRFLKVDSFWSVFGTTTFSFSATYALHLCHTQMVSISFIPAICLLGICLYKNFNNTRKRRVFLVLIILAVSILLYTSWYIFFFFSLFCIIAFVIFVLVSISKKALTCCFLNKIRSLVPEIILSVGLTIILFAPFIRLELPLLKNSGGKSYIEVASMLPEFVDFFNVSPDNILLGSLFSRMNLEERGYGIEVIEGFSIAVIFVFFVSFAIYCKKEAKKNRNRVDVAIVIALTVVVCSLLALKLSSNGVSLWILVYYLFPGGRSIRAVARIVFFLSFPLSVVTAYMGHDITRKWSKKNSYYVLMSALILFAFVANIQKNGVYSYWNRKDSLNYINSIPEPPEECEVFYLTEPAQRKGIPFVQLDAYQISDHYGIPTINGYSGLNPQGWGEIWDVYGESYSSAVKRWIDSHSINNVFVYNDSTKKWERQVD